MKISREDVEPLQVRLTVEVAPERLEAARRDVAQAYSKRYRIPGFRPGKVPPDRVAALIGEASLNEEAMEQLGREVLQAALKAEGLSSVAPVMLELLRAEPPTFVGTVSLEPQVDLGDYRALRVPEPELPEVTDDDVDEMLERLRRDAAERLPVDRPSEIGDVATLNVKGWRRAADEADPEALDLEARPADLDVAEGRLTLTAADVASAGLPDGFLDAVLGMALGQERRFSLPLPAATGAPEAPAAAMDFVVTLTELVALDLPALDDAFAAKVGDAVDLDSLRSKIGESMRQRRRVQQREAFLEAARGALESGAAVSWPPALLTQEIKDFIAEFREQLERQGIEWQAWLAQRDESALWSEFEQTAARRLRTRLVISRLVELEGLDLDQEALDRRMAMMRDMSARTPKKRRPDLQAMMVNTMNNLMMGRINERLLEIVSGQAAADLDPALDMATDLQPDPIDAEPS
ncbi:MAG TPA: trigger factor [Anaerolineae bacterium]|nr:trigger factor [Anaerolineae bacterium]